MAATERETMGGRMREGFAPSERGNVARVLALLVGLGYVAAGVIGFTVTGFTGFVANTDETFLGFFDLNIFHNIVHLSIGGALILASRVRDVTITQGVLIGVGLFYLLAAVLGFLNYLQIISIDASLSFDNFFHLFTGLVALIFGLIGARQQSESLDGTRSSPRPIEERRAAWDTEDTYREEAY
jgi:hypothetical protein